MTTRAEGCVPPEPPVSSIPPLGLVAMVCYAQAASIVWPFILAYWNMALQMRLYGGIS